MKFFIDTANLKEIEEAASMGVLDGVTTNPSLVSKEGRPFKDLIVEICKIVDGPVNAEVTATDYPSMIREGRDLAKLHKNVYVKLPMTLDGLKATKALTAEGIRINVTLIFSPTQALMAAKAGAKFASPFIGRLDDVSTVGMDLIEQIVTIYENYGYETEVLAASIRNPVHVVEAAMLGAHIATMPFSVIKQLAKHPLTDIGLKKFLEDWEKIPKKLRQ